MSNIIKHVPNSLTALRLFAALLFPFVSVGLRLYLLIFALLTEYLDGMIARKFKAESLAGQILDPIADRLFFFLAIVTLFLDEQLTSIQILFICLRDIVTLLGSLYLILFKKEFSLNDLEPRLLGKITTVFQYIVLFDLVLWLELHTVVFIVTAVISASSAGDYLTWFLGPRRSKPMKVTK